MRGVAIIALGLLLVLPGCLEGVTGPGGDQDDAPTLPTWVVGRYWRYAVATPEVDTVTTMVVAAIEDQNYMLGAATLHDAQLHAVLNYNPALGRVRQSDLALYEKGETQPLLAFPLTTGRQWEFDLFGTPGFAARVELVSGGNAYVTAEAPGGETLAYTYSTAAGWLEALHYTGPQGELRLRMTLVEYGFAYVGGAWFLRAGDLYDGDYAGPELTVYDTFLDQGHTRYGPWDYLVYYLEAEIPSGAGGELVMRDHYAVDALTRVFGPGDTEASLGTVNSVSGNWSVEVSLSGNAQVRLRVAGSIEYHWTV